MIGWITSSAQALSILRTTTWIATGLVGVVVLFRAVMLFVDFKNKPKEQKVKDLLGVISALCVIGIFWCAFFIWGGQIAAGYN